MKFRKSPNWEAELKALYDLETAQNILFRFHFSADFKTGGKLTGRQIVTTVFPLSFQGVCPLQRKVAISLGDYK
jgi:hypothetical protein